MISVSSILVNTVTSSTALALGSVGGLFGERSGISNIGLEGTMLFSAFAAVCASYYTASPWAGLAAGVAAGVLVSLLHAYFCITLKVNQSIIGLAINILAANLTVYASSSIFGNKGFTPSVAKLPDVSVPLLRDLPVVGDLFGGVSLITLLVIPIALLAFYLLYKTPYGMRVIAVGQNPTAAYVAGVNVKRTQYTAVLLGGFTCGLAGAYLSISYLSMFVRDMVSGRGFIAIAAILFGRYDPLGVCLAALFFGFADAMQIALQGTVRIPNEVIQCIPYVLTILAVTFNEARVMKRSAAL